MSGTLLKSIDWARSKIICDIDLTKPGKQFGDLRLPWSDNSAPLGYHPIPIISLVNGEGPTLLLCGGTHGDEYEGPAAIMELVHSIDLEKLRGRIIALPACNSPAFKLSSRCSPLDGGNLNRAYPGDASGGPTQMIAHCIESILMPHCDAVFDFHAGGKASIYSVLAMVTKGNDAVSQKNLEIARAFSPDYIWMLDGPGHGGSVNDAARRQNVPMMASETYGGGRVSRTSFRRNYEGLLRVMDLLGMFTESLDIPMAGDSAAKIESIENGALFAKQTGVFVPHVDLNDSVNAGDEVGTIYQVMEPERKPQRLQSPVSGVVVSMAHRGLIERGERLLLFGQIVG